MKSAFASYHPAINFLYFILVLGCAMCLWHPACSAISILCAVAWRLSLKGWRALRGQLLFLLPAMLVMALLNPAFSHQGVTILAYLPSGNPLTLESILYGWAAAALLAAVVCWFSCYNAVVTTDKFVYLFGRIIPSLSLLLSLCLRFVPKCLAQLHTVSTAQKCVGRDVSNGNAWARARHGARILSIMVTWALESAIETADSMKSRGYGLPGRTAFSLYRFDRRDRLALGAMVGLGGYTLAVALTGGFSCQYFPRYQVAALDAWTISGLLAYFLLCALPLLLELWQAYQWKKCTATLAEKGEGAT